jgi:hypothetical protein
MMSRIFQGRKGVPPIPDWGDFQLNTRDYQRTMTLRWCDPSCLSTWM